MAKNSFLRCEIKCYLILFPSSFPPMHSNIPFSSTQVCCFSEVLIGLVNLRQERNSLRTPGALYKLNL